MGAGSSERGLSLAFLLSRWAGGTHRVVRTGGVCGRSYVGVAGWCGRAPPPPAGAARTVVLLVPQPARGRARSMEYHSVLISYCSILILVATTTTTTPSG